MLVSACGKVSQIYIQVLFEPGVKGEILQGSKMHHRGWLPLPGP